MKIYEYDEILESLYRAQESEDGVDGETGMVFDITLLDQLEMERDKKIENVLLYAKQLSADANAIEDYIKDRQAIAKAKRNTADRLKNWLIERMMERDEKTFETERIRATLRVTAANKTEIIDADQIPPQYLKTKTEPDIKAIKSALKSGETVLGAQLVDSVSLTVK